MAFEIFYHPDCLNKDIPKLDKTVLKRLRQSIETRLASDPENFGKPLRYTKSGLWSLRVADWRVIYKISGHQVWVLRIGHRREVYKFF